MKYILIFILVYWVARRVFRIFAVVGSDQGPNTNTSNTNYTPPKEDRTTSSADQGEYIDFEEIE